MSDFLGSGHIQLVVGYALTCKMALPGVSDTIEEARYQTRKNGRTHITAGDLRTALLGHKIPSDAALQRAFETTQKRRISDDGVVVCTRRDRALQRHCNGLAQGDQGHVRRRSSVTCCP